MPEAFFVSGSACSEEFGGVIAAVTGRCLSGAGQVRG